MQSRKLAGRRLFGLHQKPFSCAANEAVSEAHASGLHFIFANGQRFLANPDDGGAVSVRALVRGTVNAANIFSTSPAIPQNHLVVLEDPEHNFLAGNIVPLVNSQKKSDHLKDVLDAVSAKLTTRGLADLNASVSGNSGVDPDEAARKWARDNGFDHPMRQ